MNTEIEKKVPETTGTEEQKAPDKAEYIERIKELPAEDQAFMDGYLFAIIKNSGKGA